MTHNAFARDLAEVINRHSIENVSNTPDIVLGEFLAECLDAFDAAVNQRTELIAEPVEQPQDAEVQQARAFLAELSENIRSYHQSIPGRPGCTCGRSLACGNDVPDYAAIWTLEAALDAWAPTEEDEQPQDAQPERDGDGDVRAVALGAEIATTERIASLLHDLDARTKERDEARDLACVSLDILRNVSDEPMRELYGVDDMDEMPEWFTRYRKPSAAVLDARDAKAGGER